MSSRALDPAVSMRERWQAWLAAPAWSLPRWLLLVLCLRLPAVLFADGFAFVDQQFQYVDPAWHFASGQAWHVPWEWVDGIRSPVYPMLLAGVFRVLSALGCEEPMATMRWVRGVHALFTLLPAWLFWLVVVRWRPLAAPRVPLLFVAGCGFLVAGVQPSGPAFATTLAVAAALALAGNGQRWPFVAGLCLGFAFCARFQDALFGPGFLAVLLWQRRYRAAAWFVLGCLPGILLQGFVDLAQHGTFLATPLAYVWSNLGLGIAAQWRTQPFWFYWLAGVVPLLLLVPPFVRVAWSRFRAGAIVLPAAAVGALLHLLVHSCIDRKAMRFEFSALGMLVPVLAIGLPAARSTLATWHTALLALAHAGLWLWMSTWSGNLGAVRTAEWLRWHSDGSGAAIVVDGDATSLGGFYYARPAADRVVGVSRAEFTAWTREGRLPLVPVVIAVREALDPGLCATAGLELAAAFTGQWDLRLGDRRYVYRRRL